MRGLAAIATVIIAIAGVAVASPDKARADKLFEDGRRYLATKEYALACTAFEQSQEAEPAIGTQLNIALCYETWGKLGSAYRAYLEAERLAKLKFDDRAKGAHKKVDELAGKAPHLRIEVPSGIDDGAVFLFDAKEVDRATFSDELLVDAGKHALEIRIPGQPPKLMTIELVDGEHRKVVIEVPRVATKLVVVEPAAPPRKAGRLYGGIALTAGGAIAIGVASVVALAERQDYKNAIAGCPASMCTDKADFDATQTARKRANEMTFVGAGGLALAGLGVFLILTSHGDPVVQAEHDDARLVPWLAPDLVGLAFGGRL